ncbi:calcium-responsive transcription factor-like [Haemaphysalis longicornis]
MDPDPQDDPQETIMKECLRDLTRVGENWTGFLLSDQDLQEFERRLESVRIQFCTESSWDHKSGATRFMFSSNRGALPISLDMPFQVTRRVKKDCVMGIDRNKRKDWPSITMSSFPPEWYNDIFVGKKRMRLLGTKKKGCTASMHLKWLRVYPEFQVQIPEGTGIEKTWRTKAEKIRELEEKLRRKAEVKCEQRIYVTLSPMSSHCNHDFEEMAGCSQTVNKDVSAKIHELVREGVTSTATVRLCLDYYVNNVLFADKPKPDKSCRAFFPTDVDIRNHVQAALRRDEFSSLDQSDAASLTD